MDAQRLGQGLAHGHARVERAVGILEDQLHPAIEGAPARAGERAHVGAVVDDGAGIGFDQPDQATCEGRLAATGLADNAERLAAADREADPVQGMHRPPRRAQQGLEHGPVQRKDLGEAPHLEECRRGGGIHEAAFTTWS